MCISLSDSVNKTTIMGKTADMTDGHNRHFFTRKAIHRSSLKSLSVHKVLFRSIYMESWLKGKVWLEKVHKQQVWLKSSRTWRSFLRSGLRLEYHELQCTDTFSKWATCWTTNCCIPSIRSIQYQSQHQKHLIWEEKNWTVAQWSKVLCKDKTLNVAFHLEIQSLKEECRGNRNQAVQREFPQSVMIWGDHVMFWCLSTRILESFLLLCLETSFTGMLILFSKLH